MQKRRTQLAPPASGVVFSFVQGHRHLGASLLSAWQYGDVERNTHVGRDVVSIREGGLSR